MAKFLVEILINAAGEPQARAAFDSVGSSAANSAKDVEAASLRSEASLRRIADAASKLQDQMKDTGKSSGFIADMTSLNAKIQDQIAAYKGGGDAITAWTQKNKDAALAQQILAAQVRAGVSANSDAGKQIAQQITLHSQLRSELTQVTQAQTGATAQLIDFGSAGREVGAVLGELLTKLIEFAAVVGVGLSLHKIVDDTVASQDALAQLAAGVKATGDRTGETVPKLLALASGLEETTKYSRTQIEQAESLGLTFTHISSQAFPAFMKAAADIAARTGEDLPAAVEKLGRALDTGLVTSLKRAGITFDANQQAQAKYLASTGQYSKEIALVLGEVEGKLAGSAEAARNTLGGALQVLRNQFEEAAITIGTQMSPALVLVTSELGKAANSSEFRALAVEIGQDLGTAIKGAVVVSQFLAQHLDEVKAGIAAIVAMKFAAYLSEVAEAEALVAANAVFMNAIAASKIFGIAGGFQYLAAEISSCGPAILAMLGPWTIIIAAIGAATFAFERYISEQGRMSTEMQRQLGIEGQAHASLLEMESATGKVTQATKDRAQAAGAALVAELALAKADLEHAKQLAGQKVFYPAGPERDAAITSRPEVQDAIGRVGALQIQVDKLGTEIIRVWKLPLISEQQKADVPHFAGTVTALTNTLQAYADKIADIIRKQSQQAASQEYLSDALDHGLLAYNQAVVAQERAKAITTALTQVYTAHRSEIEKLTAEYEKLTTGKSAQTGATAGDAAKVKAAIETENKAYTDQATAIGVNAGKIFDLTEANKLRLKGDQEVLTLQNQLATEQAKLTDLTSRSGEASRALALEQERQKDILALLSPAVRKQLEDLRFFIELTKEAEAVQAAVDAARRNTANVGASVADWEQQRAAVATYGSAVAGILKQYGLLSAATQRRAIDEQVLAATIKDKLTPAEAEDLRLFLEGQQKIIDGWHRMQAETEINEKRYKEFADQLAQDLSGIVGNFLKGEKVGLEDFANAIQDTFASVLQNIVKDWLTKWFEAMAEWLARWIATQAAARAAQAGLGTSGTGPVSSPTQYASLLGGGGGASIWGSAGTAGVAGSGSGAAGLFSGTGAAGAAGSVVAWVAVLYLFAKAVNSLNAHIQKTGESVINLGHTLDITTPVSDNHVAGLIATGKQLAEQIQEFFIAFGGIFAGLDSTIGVKRRGQGSNTQWKVYADGIVTNFGKDMQAALDFAEIEAIKHSSSVGLDPLVAAAIKDYAGKSLDAFKAQIEFAQRIATQNLPGISGQLSSAATQYFADLHQAQVQFAGDLPALDAAIQSIIKKFDDTVQGIKNSALGIDTSTSDFLAGVVGFQQQMAKTSSVVVAQLQQQIDDALKQIAAMGSGPRRGLKGDPDGVDPTAQADWDAKLAQLRKNVAEYKAELAKIPKALSDSEVNMAVFDSLYKYLQGNVKYAALAAEYAKEKVDDEFAIIKLQLIALGKWEQFAGMWQDALNAAEKSATTQARARPSGGGSGTSPADERATLRAQIATLRAEAQGALHASFLDLTNQIEAFTKSAKAAKLPAAELAQGIDLLTKKFQEGVLAQAQSYAGIGTDFTTRLTGVTNFFHEIEDLGRAKTGIPNWLEQLLKGKALDKLGTELNASIDQFNGLVDPMVAINEQADGLRQNVLAYGKAAGWSADQINAALGKIGAGAEYQREGAINGIMDTLFGYLKDDKAYAGQTAELKKKEVDLQFRLIEAQLKALDAWDAETQKVFDAAKQAAEDAASGAAAAYFNYAAAVQEDRGRFTAASDQAVQAWRQAISQFTQQTQAVATNPALSGLTQDQQFAAAKQQFDDLVAKARGGDAAALAQVDQARQTDLALAHAEYGGGEGFIEEYRRVMGASADLLAHAQQGEDAARAAAESITSNASANAQGLTTAVFDAAAQVAQAIYASFAGLPHYAEGGIALRPHLALLGERGPEAIIPLSRPVVYPPFGGGRVLPFSQERGAAAPPSAGGGGELGAAVARLAEAQSRMASDIRSIAESSARTARSNDNMMRTERIKRAVARRG